VPLTTAQLKQLTEESAEPNRLRLAMKLAGVTQVELAEAVGFTQSHISEIVNGNYSSLPLETAQKLADYFGPGCSTDLLFPLRAA
jgi:transcriptional regulator with XRE-family HTH domain